MNNTPLPEEKDQRFHSFMDGTLQRRISVYYRSVDGKETYYFNLPQDIIETVKLTGEQLSD